MSQQPNQDILEIILPAGVKVCVSNNFHQMTSYILLEQEDWFEDEMDFIRSLIRPEMAALDIGANHGVYALTMAGLLQGKGHVWAVEPANEPASLLRKSIVANAFEKELTLVQCALSDHEGTATLHLGFSSELNTLQDGVGGESETIVLRTLDSVADEFIDRPIDFIKLDAEGEETKVVAGGRRFFEKHSPLVMFELKHGSAVNYELCAVFSDLGMKNYYLVPGLNALVPVDDPHTLDGYTLNLFACSDQTAARYASRGQLLTRETLAREEDVQGFLSQYPWQDRLLSKRIAAAFRPQALQGLENPGLYHLCLAAVLAFEDRDVHLSMRWLCAKFAKTLFESMFGRPNAPFVSVFACIRLLRGMGCRSMANAVVGNNLQNIEKLVQQSFSTVWLPLFPSSDCKLPEHEQLPNWFYLEALKFLEANRSFSSYFINDDSLMQKALVHSRKDPFWLRRYALVTLRKGQKLKIGENSPLFADSSDEHRNGQAWRILWSRMMGTHKESLQQ